jgi:hypothetical protein
VSAIRGGKNPLSVLDTSNREEACGTVVPIPTWPKDDKQNRIAVESKIFFI